MGRAESTGQHLWGSFQMIPLITWPPSCERLDFGVRHTFQMWLLRRPG